MKINIYYGGRGLIDDPTLYVINKMQEVLEELRVTVVRFNLYEMKNSITTLPQTLKDVDGIILASTVEWHGIGGYMHQFLDACWLYGDKEKISQIYMCPIVMSTTYGEREGKLDLSVAWEILGGLPCSGICGYISDTVSLEMDKNYMKIIEKKAENMYRTINQKTAIFPASNQVIKQMVSVTKNIDLAPQELEQLSQYASDESYVQRQKEDIQELTDLFKGLLENQEKDEDISYVEDFERCFRPEPGIKAVYRFQIDDGEKIFIIEVDGPHFKCYYGNVAKADVDIKVSSDTMNDIVFSKMTFQKAFMSGNMKTKGDFKLLRALDQMFVFQ
ncbi:SCP2 sterol-binding domain-containing protein [Lachnospiraceae bacterium JLR.KK008]